ncbi:3-phosphoglycerate dehydrogenase family protein [Echinimonas agarilytica]|uniref:D-3-phosphoglycerate dehydrogenase n=1 Tax=Echinimonas agarilytica TaxID=1215918 RepID=A0AA41W4Y9_9GAMM|nr:3-phosphoglycerate dehydrogenase family protein [Echinimonas agarilytica]MCM2678876.1 3-phosphoglycerate dehydrogenase family protein [Echinimonas agarilytica]
MHSIRTYNAISPTGLSLFPSDSYHVDSVVGEPDAIMLRSHNLHQESFPDKVKAIARCGAGVNNIPIEQCTEQGIVVFNTPGANANAVKELVLAGMLMSSRNLSTAAEFCQNLDQSLAIEDFNKLVEGGKKRFVGSELTGKTLGVIGLGAIGANVAHAALALGMKVVGYDPVLSVDAAWRLSSEVERADNLPSLLARCDFVTVHVPANEYTVNMLNAENLEQAKRGLVILNFARGTIVEENAIVSEIESGRIHRYVSDFPSAQLMGREQVILLPHLGASTGEAEDNCAQMAARQLMDFLENGNIKNSVNFPEIHLSRTEGHRIAFANDNVPKVLSTVLAVLSDMDINVIDMLNKSRGEIAYTILDVEHLPTDDLIQAIENIEHVFHVNVF